MLDVLINRYDMDDEIGGPSWAGHVPPYWRLSPVDSSGRYRFDVPAFSAIGAVLKLISPPPPAPPISPPAPPTPPPSPPVPFRPPISPLTLRPPPSSQQITPAAADATRQQSVDHGTSVRKSAHSKLVSAAFATLLLCSGVYLIRLGVEASRKVSRKASGKASRKALRKAQRKESPRERLELTEVTPSAAVSRDALEMIEEGELRDADTSTLCAAAVEKHPRRIKSKPASAAAL